MVWRKPHGTLLYHCIVGKTLVKLAFLFRIYSQNDNVRDRGAEKSRMNHPFPLCKELQWLHLIPCNVPQRPSHVQLNMVVTVDITVLPT